MSASGALTDQLSRPRVRARLLVALLAAITVALLLAGCGGGSSPGVVKLGKSHHGSNTSSSSSNGGVPSSAAAGGTPSSSPSSSESGAVHAAVVPLSPTGARYSGAQLVEFARCARANGVPDFPDPSSRGAFVGVAPGSPELQQADEKCGKYLPHPTLSPAQKQQQLKQVVGFSACMRSHGVPNFPDPETTSGGDWTLSIQRSAGLDPSSPIFDRADHTCNKLHAMPGGGLP